MNRRNRILAVTIAPALLAVGVAAGVVLAQGPSEGETSSHGEGHIMDPAMMEAHMQEVHGEGGYAQMLESMRNHGSGMGMSMDGSHAMRSCQQTGSS